MKKILTLAAALLVFGASASMAQGGLNMYWNNCGAGGGLTNASFLCNTNSGAAFVMNLSVFPAVSYNTFASASAVVDVQVAGGVLPAWWQTNTGQCRANFITINFDPTLNTTACTTDIWAFSTIVQVSAMQQGVNGPDRLRINGLAAIPAGSEVPLVADGVTDYYLAKVSIFRNNTLTCAGCALGACIVFNESKLLSPTEPQQVITLPADNNSVTWQGGGGLNCPGATPAQNRTWGAVKNLYR